MNKRIRIATTGTYPDGMASTYRIDCYAKGLIEEGALVEVISTKSHRPYPGKVFNYRSEVNGIPFTILWNPRRFKMRWSEYLWAEANSYVLLCHCLLTIRKYDVLWLYGMGVVPRLLLIPALRLFGKKIVLELNEFPYSTEGSKFTRLRIVRNILTWATLRLVFPQLNGVVVISENLKTVVKRYAPFVPVLKVPILLDPSRAALQADNGVQRQSRPHPNPYIFHAGSLSIQKDGIVKVVEAYARAATELKKFSVQLDLIFTNKNTFPGVWKAINRVLHDYSLQDRLKVTGYLTEAELQHYLRNVNVLLVNKPSLFQNRYNFPTKLGDYLLSGRPVIVACEGTELNNYLEDDVNCRVLRPDDVGAMANALVDLCLNPDKAKVMGQSGRTMALEHFAYRGNARRINDFLAAL